MRKYKSFWYLESGELVCAPETDRHELLALARGIKGGFCQSSRALRGEFAPPKNPEKIQDLETWTLTVDESTVPDWWAEKKDDCLRKIATVVKSEMITDKRECVLGGCWIVCKTGSIVNLIGGRIAWAIGADLYGANLNGADLYGADLYGADLYGADLYGAIRSENDPPIEGWKVVEGRLEKCTK